jgi:hypothetical protein
MTDSLVVMRLAGRRPGFVTALPGEAGTVYRLRRGLAWQGGGLRLAPCLTRPPPRESSFTRTEFFAQPLKATPGRSTARQAIGGNGTAGGGADPNPERRPRCCPRAQSIPEQEARANRETDQG